MGERLVDGFFLAGQIQEFGFSVVFSPYEAKHLIIHIRRKILPVITPYERCVLVDKQQTVFGKNALAGSDQLPSELCIFRIIRIIGRQPLTVSRYSLPILPISPIS